MIQSMTGYGKAEINGQHKKITVELKSLNSKQTDINTRIPHAYRSKELEIRNRISSSLIRGKIDFAIHLEHTGPSGQLSINAELVKSYFQELKSIAQDLGSKEELLNIVMRMPEVLNTSKNELDQKEWQDIEVLITSSLDQLLKYRIDEGKKLAQDFKLRIEHIKTYLENIQSTEQERIDTIKLNLRQKLDQLKESVDQNRFEQELIYYLEKLDITEEITRLHIHLEYFLECLNQSPSQGKKLGFIFQEIGREINTIGSKSNQASMQQLVVNMKDELEKIKEQILNVL
jgi:uncharacterized protein (TIGR00255 family)